MIEREDKLVARAAGGDPTAFGRLYDHYHPQIYRYVLLKVTHREEAEDLTHQVFMHAWSGISSYRNVGFPFSSWLYRIAHNQVVDFYRTRKQDASLNEIDPEGIPDASSIQNTHLRMEVEEVMKALSTLKQEYQDVVLMRFVEELSVKETAAALHKTEGAVKVIQHRALRQLKDMLNPKHPQA